MREGRKVPTALLGRLDRMFDPYLTSDHRAVVVLTDNLLESFEYLGPTRKRRMKERDRQNLEAVLRALVSNLARTIAEGATPPAFAVGLRATKRRLTRYDRPGFSGLPAILERLSEHGGLLTLKKSGQKGTASAVIASPGIREALSRFRFGPEHFRRQRGGETICLSRTKRDYVGDSPAREWIDYAETPETVLLRKEVETINYFLAASNMGLEDDGGTPVHSHLRQLRRYFKVPPGRSEAVERFDLGGRLFGGWWQELPKERRFAIRIDGEPVTDLDFSSMFLRLAYLQAGLSPPEGDLYGTVPGLAGPRWRSGVKKVASAMLFRSLPLTRLPKDTVGLLPPGSSGSQVRSAILAAHPGLAAVFETGIGLDLMFVESRIMVAVLIRLLREGITALPMHDGLMVASSKEDAAARALQGISEQITGERLPITLKRLG